MKVERKERGDYYDKTVEYKRNKSSSLAHLGTAALGLALGIGISGYVIKPLLGFVAVIIFSVVIYIVNFYATHDRKVKYRRLR